MDLQGLKAMTEQLQELLAKEERRKEQCKAAYKRFVEKHKQAGTYVEVRKKYNTKYRSPKEQNAVSQTTENTIEDTN